MQPHIIAIDLDGTLLQKDGTVSTEDTTSIVRCIENGHIVVPCTGRLYEESLSAIKHLPFSYGLFATGAMIQQMPDGQLIESTPLELTLAQNILQIIKTSDLVPLLLCNPLVSGTTYLSVGKPPHPISRWWFEKMGLTCLTKDPSIDDLSHALRVSLLGPPQTIVSMEQKLRQTHKQHIEYHMFPTLKSGDDGITPWILELFHPSINKWHGLMQLANVLDKSTIATVAIGDQDNDLPMLRNATISIAMDNAIENAKKLACFITASNNEHGVSKALKHFGFCD